ncbi:MAG: nucleoside monophosphate kinase [Buchnera aphidicola (Floraphis choui)]
MRIVLLGAPGSGKGTQAEFIATQYHLPIISVGEILRKSTKNDTSISKTIKNTMNNGKLISDTIIIKLVKNYISQTTRNPGFILDGFPRTIAQAKTIENKEINVDYIFEFKIPSQIILERIKGRRIDPISGKTYHLNTENYSKNLNKIDLARRIDDSEIIIKKRLEEYKKFTIPLINHFNKTLNTKNFKYYTINGTKTIQDINKKIKNILNKDTKLQNLF